MVAARGGYRRAETLLGAITDEYRHARVSVALAAIRNVELRPNVNLYRRARALASLAEVAAAGGTGHAWGVSDWAEPLVRYRTDRSDQVLIFAALAAGAAGGEDNGRAAALADRAEAIVAPIPDPEHQPQALVTLAWMVADAGDPTRAAELAHAAEALTRYTRRYLRTWRVVDLAAIAKSAAGEGRAAALPELTGTPKQRKWAQDLRTTFVARRWGAQIPAEARASLARLTEAQWWINNRNDLDGALGNQAGIWNDDNLPEIAGTPKQEGWARKLRARLIGKQWPDGMPPRVAAALADLTDARWWIDNREKLDMVLVEFAETFRTSELSEIAGAPRQRKRATDIRAKLVHRRWGNKIPPGVREILNRLTDAEWWIANDVGDGYSMSIDRAVGKLLSREDRNRMGLPNYGPPPKPGYSHDHDGLCKDQPVYAEAYAAAFAVISEHGDVRSPSAGGLRTDNYGQSCCGQAGWHAGQKDGEETYVEKYATELRHTRGLSLEKARAEARSYLTRFQRALNGRG